MESQQIQHQAWGSTDAGKKRERNEDSLIIADDICLYAVADGMGGHAGGATASKLAIQTIEEIIRQNIDNTENSDSADLEMNPAAILLRDSLRGACSKVHEMGNKDYSLHGMGTTTTALLLRKDHAYIAHVGDSRAYLLRRKKLSQLSEDHSLVNEQMKAGLLSAAEARSSRLRNIITRSIGFEQDVDVDMIALQVLPNDKFLLCSDGLTSMMTDPEIEKILLRELPEKVPQALIDSANLKGGDDNITVILVQLTTPVAKQAKSS